MSSLLFISSTVTLPASIPASSSRGVTGLRRIPWSESLTRSLIPCFMLYFLLCSTGMVTWPFRVTLTICSAIWTQVVLLPHVLLKRSVQPTLIAQSDQKNLSRSIYLVITNRALCLPSFAMDPRLLSESKAREFDFFHDSDAHALSHFRQ